MPLFRPDHWAGQRRLKPISFSSPKSIPTLAPADCLQASDACKQSAGASVGIDFGEEKDIGFSLRCPAQWSGRNRGIAAQGKLVLQQLFNSALIYEQQDNVHCFQTNLEPKRSTSDFER